MHCIALWFISLHCTVFDWIGLYSIILFCIVWCSVITYLDMVTFSSGCKNASKLPFVTAFYEYFFTHFIASPYRIVAYYCIVSYSIELDAVLWFCISYCMYYLCRTPTLLHSTRWYNIHVEGDRSQVSSVSMSYVERIVCFIYVYVYVIMSIPWMSTPITHENQFIAFDPMKESGHSTLGSPCPKHRLHRSYTPV